VAVQQIQEALADRQPRVTIEAPNDGANLPNGNWTLKLTVQDWPLHDAGALGIGPHVVVQIDDQAPIRLSEHRPGPKGDSVQISLPPLAPGSHRITTYAATPWGEAARSPGAASQIRVDRVAANPVTLPEAGSPQVLGVSPMGSVGGEPVLLDWLLLDAPLQHLRDNDGSWRLRIAVNDERFVVDQNVPLWLKGWKTGSNSLQLELVDGRGKPLNPPFNSLVSEVVLKPSTNPPRWQQGRLSPAELAALLGQTPPPAVASKPKPTASPRPEQRTQPQQPKAPPPEATQPDANPQSAEVPAPPAPEEPAVEPPLEEGPVEEAPADAVPLKTAQPEADPAEGVPAKDLPAEGMPAVEMPAAQVPELVQEEEREEADLPAERAPAAPATADVEPAETGTDHDSEALESSPPANNEPLTAGLASQPVDAIKPEDAGEPMEAGESEPEQPSQELISPSQASPESPKAIANPDRISPSSNVAGSAREQVREDGSLIKPKREGFFGGLLDRVGA
jgi:hypothetical protein